MLLWVLGDGGMKGLIWSWGQLDPPCLPLLLCCPLCPPTVLATSTTCRGGQGAPQCSLLAPSPLLKRCFLPGCEGEERGGSTCPEAMVMGTTMTLATDLKEGPDPSCAATHLVQGFKGFPRAPGATTQSGSSPAALFYHDERALTSHNPGTSVGPMPWGCPLLLPACSLPGAPDGS